MANQAGNDFEASGLSRLTTMTRWHDDRYRKSIMASLVKGVYVLKDDHRRHRQGIEALAPPWWESFGFKLLHPLMDDGDSSIFGAVYEYNKPTSNNHEPTSFFMGFLWFCISLLFPFYFSSFFMRFLWFCLYVPLLFLFFISFTNRPTTTTHNHQDLIGAPKYVIAFRGTSLNRDTAVGDMSLNKDVCSNRLHRTSRFKKAIKAVENMVSEKGASNIWLAGHSLGAAIAMLSGKTMAKEGIYLESYLFNPPFIAAPIGLIGNRTLRFGVHGVCTFITIALNVVLQNDEETQQSENLFTTLSPWVPNLFLHPSDPICSGYIGYFEHREMLTSFGVGVIGNLATRYSWQGLFMTAIGSATGTEFWSEETSHLIPSASVTTSCHPQAHKLSQWFTDDSVSDPKLYRYI